MNVVLATLLLVAQPAAGDDSGSAVEPKTDSQANLETAIPAMVKLLEKKEYVKLIRTYVSPEDVAKITKEMTIETLAEEFGKSDKPAELIRVLKHVTGKTPKLDESGNRAVFEYELEGIRKMSITFVRVEKKWYVEN